MNLPNTGNISAVNVEGLCTSLHRIIATDNTENTIQIFWRKIMEKIDKVTKIEILVTDEGAQMYFNGYREAVPIAYPELRKAVMIMLDLCTQVQKTIIQKEKEND